MIRNSIKLIYPLIVLFALSGCRGYEVDGNYVYYTYWNEGSGSHKIIINGADPSTFKELEHSSYGKDQYHAYYEDKVIKYADPATFQSVSDYYAKDSRFAYYQSYKINGADGSNFQEIDDAPYPYAKDKKDYYHDSIPVHVYDYNSFKILNYGEAVDKKFYYLLKNSSFEKHPIADYKSFTLLEESYGTYEKDKYNVYFHGEVIKGADPATFSVIDYAKGKDAKYEYYGKCRIDDPKSFVELKDGYSKDKVSIYFEYEKITGADPASFAIVNQYWTKDKSNAYVNGKKANLDFSSFNYLIGMYVKDSKNVFYLDSLMAGANADSAVATDYWDWIKDNKSYFYTGKKLEGIDYATFQILRNDYSKDINNVYFQLTKVEGADTKTFRATDGTYGGQDKYGTYYMGKR